ncbi:uncharacterized protein LOC128250372 [Octopus bimaculoides]|uniref:uncharacterized protein LOC128250372 n=1 Tax=Octopus bimaculoides TaxID=37653 RepID=UPI0022E430B2|nr:uncharacterized protein LOC128250372 [Octopus bimaculoides]
MACLSDWILRYGCFLWIFTWLSMDTHAKRTQTFYMEGDGCTSQRLTGATVFSHHRTASKKLFKHKTECTMTFYAAIKGWKLMLRMIELDIPDRTSKGICNDAVYIYDHKSVYANGMVSVRK